MLILVTSWKSGLSKPLEKNESENGHTWSQGKFPFEVQCYILTLILLK